MQCLNCGGTLVMRETLDYPIDENGVYWKRDTFDGQFNTTVVCTLCGASHAYEKIHTTNEAVTIALETNQDPKPVATIAIGFRGGVVDEIGAKQLVGLIAIDEDRQEVGMFLARPGEPDPWLDRAWELVGRVKKGEWKASFAEEEAEHAP